MHVRFRAEPPWLPALPVDTVGEGIFRPARRNIADDGDCRNHAPSAAGRLPPDDANSVRASVRWPFVWQPSTKPSRRPESLPEAVVAAIGAEAGLFSGESGRRHDIAKSRDVGSAVCLPPRQRPRRRVATRPLSVVCVASGGRAHGWIDRCSETCQNPSALAWSKSRR